MASASFGPVDWESCFENPRPSFRSNDNCFTFSFKEDSSLFTYLRRNEPAVFRNIGFYRLNLIILALFRAVKKKGLFCSHTLGLVVCDTELEKALGFSWFRVDTVKSVLIPHLDRHVEKFRGNAELYFLGFKTEREAILSLIR